MKVPKCPKSVSGKHSWVKERFGVVGAEKDSKTGLYAPKFGMFKIRPHCRYCKMVDDRKK